MYADDTIIIKSSKTEIDLKTCLENQLLAIDYWLNLNKLTINTSKTKAIFFGNKRKLNKYHQNNLTILYKDTPLVSEKCVKYLGVLFDEELTWVNHIKHVKNRAYYKLRKLTYINKCLTPHTKKLLINALIIPYIKYCSSSWSNATDSNLKCMQKLYDHCLKFQGITSKPVTKLWDIDQAIMTFKIIHNMVPSYLINKVTLTNKVHPHQTRAATSNSLHTIQKINTFSARTFSYRAPLISRTFSYRAPLIWNKLSEKCKATNNINIFRCKLNP